MRVINSAESQVLAWAFIGDPTTIKFALKKKEKRGKKKVFFLFFFLLQGEAYKVSKLFSMTMPSTLTWV